MLVESEEYSELGPVVGSMLNKAANKENDKEQETKVMEWNTISMIYD